MSSQIGSSRATRTDLRTENLRGHAPVVDPRRIGCLGLARCDIPNPAGLRLRQPHSRTQPRPDAAAMAHRLRFNHCLFPALWGLLRCRPLESGRNIARTRAMNSAARVSVLVAASISLVVGLRDGGRLPRPSERELRWTSIFAPLADAPIPAGKEVALLAAPLPDQENPVEPLYEAVARRPDLDWRLFDGAGTRPAPDLIVVVGAVSPPAGWQPRWRSGHVLMLVRNP